MQNFQEIDVENKVYGEVLFSSQAFFDMNAGTVTYRLLVTVNSQRSDVDT